MPTEEGTAALIELSMQVGPGIAPKEQGSEGYWRRFRMASSETQYGEYVGGDTRVEVCGASIVQAWSRRRHRAPEGPYKSARFPAPGAERLCGVAGTPDQGTFRRVGALHMPYCNPIFEGRRRRLVN